MSHLEDSTRYLLGQSSARPSLLKRLIWRLFPFRFPDCPKLPAGASGLETIVETKATVVLDWRDLLRILISGKIVVKTRTLLDKEDVRAIETTSVSYIPFYE